MNRWWRHNLAALLADKKKLVLVTGLSGVALLLWGRLLLKDIPRTAVADPNQSQAAAVPGRPSPPAPLAGPQAPPVSVDLPNTLARDLFLPDLGTYAKAGNKQTNAAPVEKSEEKPTDETLKAAAVRRAAAGLLLQSTMLGQEPRAMINGQMLRVGQTIKGFELRRVLDRQVLLRMNGIEIVLEM